MPMSVIQPILRRLLNIHPKTNEERVFIHRRLCLLDRLYCFELHRNLWQSYLDIGRQFGTWPVSTFHREKFILQYFI